MFRNRAISVFFLAALASLPGCGAILLFGEKGLADCATGAYEELERTEFILRRKMQNASPELRIQLRVYRDCRVDPGRDLRALGIKEIYFRNPRSASPELVLVLDSPSDGQTSLECSTIYRAGEDLVFACPEGYYFELFAAP